MAPITHILLPDTGAELIRKELGLAFAQAGYRVSRVDPAALFPRGERRERHKPGAAGTGDMPEPSACPPDLDSLLENGRTLFLSVNFQGLARMEEVWRKMRAAGGDVVVWCVDNPWNLLSGVKDSCWREMLICVTDKSFVAPLRGHGASRVLHLPLAGCPELFAHASCEQRVPPPEDLAPIVFVGRSAFPGKDRFFCDQKLPDEALRQAKSMLRQGERPDLLWWEQRLGLGKAVFWPGKNARQAAFGAEQANLIWRALCLEAAGKAALSSGGLDIFGDAGWGRRLPPGTRLFPPVDYYTRLPAIYAGARYSLALTSMQLPEGLNQRHFDVWLAGGICLTDATPGLALFPEELARPVTFRKPDEIALRIRELEQGDTAKELAAAWRACLLREHTYANRVKSLMEALERGGRGPLSM